MNLRSLPIRLLPSFGQVICGISGSPEARELGSADAGGRPASQRYRESRRRCAMTDPFAIWRLLRQVPGDCGVQADAPNQRRSIQNTGRQP
jgi:hypothetical protein